MLACPRGARDCLSCSSRRRAAGLAEEAADTCRGAHSTQRVSAGKSQALSSGKKILEGKKVELRQAAGVVRWEEEREYVRGCRSEAASWGLEEDWFDLRARLVCGGGILVGAGSDRLSFGKNTGHGRYGVQVGSMRSTNSPGCTSMSVHGPHRTPPDTLTRG